MQARPGTWFEVEVGSYVLDLAGGTWRVDDEKQGWLKLAGRGGDTKSIRRPASQRAVTILEPTEDEAVSLLTEILGADKVGTKDDGAKSYKCPPFARTGEMNGPSYSRARNHLKMFHGMYVDDVKTYPGLTEAHDDSHGNPDMLYFIPHTHDER